MMTTMEKALGVLRGDLRRVKMEPVPAGPGVEIWVGGGNTCVIHHGATGPRCEWWRGTPADAYDADRHPGIPVMARYPWATTVPASYSDDEVGLALAGDECPHCDGTRILVDEDADEDGTQILDATCAQCGFEASRETAADGEITSETQRKRYVVHGVRDYFVGPSVNVPASGDELGDAMRRSEQREEHWRVMLMLAKADSADELIQEALAEKIVAAGEKGD